MIKTALLNDIPQMRAVNLLNYIEVSRFLGVEPYAMLREAKIAPSAIADPETWIAATSIVELYEETAKRAGCLHFGLLMAECRSFDTLGPVSLLLQQQTTARSIVEALAQYERQISDIVLLALEDDGETALISVDFVPKYGQRQTVEATVAVVYRSLNELMVGRWRPERIHFRHFAPPDLAAHRRIFRCPVEFDSDFDGISCSSESLDLTNACGSPGLAVHAERFLDMLAVQRPRGSATNSTRHTINLLLSHSHATMDKAADNLGLHPRALQRLLEKEGTSFVALLNETRREMALRYLITSDHSLGQISNLLGYSSPSSFSRWFVGEFGKAPAAWRSAGRAETDLLPAPRRASALGMH